MKIQFLGAAGTVTGSKFYLQTDQHKVMVDCGMFQGRKAIRERNWEKITLDASAIDATLLTHAHIDHTGLLPKFGAAGMECKIHCTWGTRDLAKILLADAGRLQEEEANWRNKKKKSKHKPALPLFTVEDAERVTGFLKGHHYDESFEPIEGWSAIYRDAGHILGSAWLDLKPPTGERIVFSGDLGRTNAPILKDPVKPQGACDILFLESTYGNRSHANTDKMEDLTDIVMRVCGGGGTLVIPAFAVERTQEVLYMLEELIRGNAIPNLPVFIDSPMAVRATRLFREYRDYYDEETTALVRQGERVLSYKNLKLCESVQDSKSILNVKGPKIIISASGMATGGRILHHLKNYLRDEKNHVLMVGYQSVGTRGWRLLNGEEEIKIFGDFIPVNAGVSKLEGFSGHADHNEILEWTEGFEKPPGVTYLVHGEEDSLQAQAEVLKGKGWNVVIPEHNQVIEV